MKKRMDKYSRYLRAAQQQYFRDCLSKVLDCDFTISEFETLWEHQQSLPFEIHATINTKQIKGLSANMYIRTITVWSADKKKSKGTFCLTLYITKENKEGKRIYDKSYYINPLTFDYLDLTEENEERYSACKKVFSDNLFSWEDSFISIRQDKTNIGIKNIVLSYYDKCHQNEN